MWRSCAACDERLEIVERAVARMDVPVVGDVVAVVLERRGEERQQPQAGDAEPLQVVELLRQAGEVADAVVVAVEERLDVRLVDDRVLVPERIVVPARGRAPATTASSRHGSSCGGFGSHRMCPWRMSGIEAHVVPLAAPGVARRRRADRER